MGRRKSKLRFCTTLTAAEAAAATEAPAAVMPRAAGGRLAVVREAMLGSSSSVIRPAEAASTTVAGVDVEVEGAVEMEACTRAGGGTSLDNNHEM